MVTTYYKSKYFYLFVFVHLTILCFFWSHLSPLWPNEMKLKGKKMLTKKCKNQLDY